MTNLLIGLFLLSAPALANEFCEAKLDVAQAIEIVENTARELKSDATPHLPVLWRERTGSLGLPALDLPRTHGGHGFGVRDMARVFARAGQIALNLRDVVGAGHARLLLASTRPKIAEIVRAVPRGQAYVAIAITEEHAGSDLHQMTSRAEAVRGGFALTGEKLYNARLASATHVILFTKSASAPDRLDTFVIPRDHPGLVIESLDAHGLHGNSFGGLRFERMFVADDSAIALGGGGGQVFRDHFAYWRLMMAAAAIGTGEGALEQVVERLRTRTAFGGPIGRFTHLQQPLAEHTAKLRMARLLVDEAAATLDRGDQTAATPLVAMAKAEGVEFALAAADFAMKTFGAEGYSTRVDLGQRVVDLMGLRIADGTTDVLRAEVVRQTYGMDFWEMATGPRPPPASMMIGAPLVMGAAPGAAAAAVAPPTPAPTWARQSDFDPLIRPDGGGACASATAFNLVQLLNATDPGARDLNPHAVLGDAFTRQPELLDGRVTNAQFENLVRLLAEKHLPDLDVKLKFGTELSRRGSKNQRVLAFLVYAKDGRLVGRHFVLVTGRTGKEITALDPRDPAVEVHFLAHRDEDGQWLLRRPDGRREYLLDTVIDVRVKARALPRAAPPEKMPAHVADAELFGRQDDP